MTMTPFTVSPGEGTTMDTPTGSSVTIKADTRRTSGSMTVLEFTINAKDGPALHTHIREDELWWVLEGEFRFKLGDSIAPVSQGGMAFGPRGVPHTFQNTGDTPGRLLVITTPSGVERFFEQAAALLPAPIDPDVLAAVGRANWTEFVGPPIAVSDPLPPNP